jgi:hypothetical protein
LPLKFANYFSKIFKGNYCAVDIANLGFLPLKTNGDQDKLMVKIHYKQRDSNVKLKKIIIKYFLDFFLLEQNEKPHIDQNKEKK